ncbi:MAG TPA: ABC transporter ATP-binding protein [Candidatus Saccharimonadales bacterium]|jgi:ABC-type polysaccharide/polyol phosphate transport system ATPase subunit|nr:ABC transporter ATP-binding protein [Candidatus Saccharimonadales bacterium]
MTAAIRAEHVAKSYLVRRERRRTLKEQLLRQYGPRQRVEALKDVTFAVEPGETYGIVGANGSGKSTLLKLIAGTAKPTSGVIAVQGRVSALLELGAGFHPDFTGRENVYLNASILGLTRKETDRVLPAIVDFAELGDFFDAGVKTYSSGMYMRLAFAVAAHVDPDVLLIDEILAVGDEYFQRKCFAKLNEFRARKKTICFVSHDLVAVSRLCTRGMLLERGDVRAEGDIRRVMEAYAEIVEAHEEGTMAGAAPTGDRWGSGELRIDEVTLHADGAPAHILRSGELAEIRLAYTAAPEVRAAIFGLTIYRDDGVSVYGTNTEIDQQPVAVRPSGSVTFRVEHLPLLPGRYELDVAALSPEHHTYDYHSKRFAFRVSGVASEMGTTRIEHRWEIA